MSVMTVFHRHVAPAAAYAVAACALLFGAAARADDAALYDSPDAAAAALQEATKSGDRDTLKRVLGPAVEDLYSGDDVQDRNDREDFAEALAKSRNWEKNDDGSMTLHVGADGFPFPIPLRAKDAKWYFDTAAGKDEIVNRRIGENELRTIAVCRAYVDAQREYDQQDWDGDGVLEFAQKFRSTDGQKDGLYWPSNADENPSPMGPLVARARAEGYTPQARADAAASPAASQASAEAEKAHAAGASRPYYGYVYKQLHGQGEKTPGGKFDYIINGNQVAGFAMAAYPASYGDSGIMTFLVNASGVIWQKDLGEKTSDIMASTTICDVDETWTKVNDERTGLAAANP